MFNELSLREKILLILGVLLVLGALYYFYLYLPQQEAIAALEARYVSLKQQLEDLEVLNQEYQKLKEQYSKLDARWKNKMNRCYTREDFSGILKEIEALAKELNLEIMNIIPGSLSKTGTFYLWPLNINLKGDFKGLSYFLGHLERDLGMVKIKELKISSSGEGLLSCGLKLEFLLKEEGEQG